MTRWPHALLKLVFFIILLPFSVTLVHVIHGQQQQSHLLFIGSVAASPFSQETRDNIKTTESSYNDLYGMYHGVSSQQSGNNKKRAPTLFSKDSGLPRWHNHWPSIAHVATVLATPTSTLLQRGSEHGKVAPARVIYDESQRKWCVSSVHHQICSSPTDKDSTAPPSGVWTNDTGDKSIRVLYKTSLLPESKTSSTSSKPVDKEEGVPAKFRRNPNKRSRANRTLQQVLRTPVTFLLIAVNVILAFIYWNRGTNPASVSKIYDKIVNDCQYWRAFTGATAHFEPLHLGFNMMALYSLGTELEPSFGSIPFLFYNISLIPITTCIMMGIVYLQIRRTGDASLGETSTVGYSGVLFCWMVITSLERPETCPIPFLPDVCFATHTFWKFRFNVSPIIQLFVAQAIMKRVSFVGHLAGIVAGFLLHWNLLPLELVQPEVLIPGLYLLLLWRARKVIPVTRLNEDDQSDGDEGTWANESPPSSGRFDGRRVRREKDQRIHVLLVRMRTALLVTTVLSAFVFDALGGMFLSSVIGFCYFCCCVQSHALLLNVPRDSAEYQHEKARLGTLWKGFILSCVLTIVCDSMSLAGWIVSSVYWQNDNGTSFTLMSACIMLLVRLTVEVTAVVVACKSLSGIGETGGGLFVVVFGHTVLENGRIIGTTLYSRITKTKWTAFEGEGVTLGASNVSSEPTSSNVV